MKRQRDQRLTREFLEDRLERLSGWQDDVQKVIEEMPERTQKASERLAAAMTEEELDAAEQIFWRVESLLHQQAERVYDKMGMSDDIVTVEDAKAISWPVFLRCLATYDPAEAHLTT